MVKFNVGDRVVVTNSRHGSYEKLGVVTALQDVGNCYYVQLDQGGDPLDFSFASLAHHPKPTAAEPEKKEKPMFAVGDRVVVTAEASTFCGKRGVVTKVECDDQSYVDIEDCGEILFFNSRLNYCPCAKDIQAGDMVAVNKNGSSYWHGYVGQVKMVGCHNDQMNVDFLEVPDPAADKTQWVVVEKLDKIPADRKVKIGDTVRHGDHTGVVSSTGFYPVVCFKSNQTADYRQAVVENCTLLKVRHADLSGGNSAGSGAGGPKDVAAADQARRHVWGSEAYPIGPPVQSRGSRATQGTYPDPQVLVDTWTKAVNSGTLAGVSTNFAKQADGTSFKDAVQPVPSGSTPGQPGGDTDRDRTPATAGARAAPAKQPPKGGLNMWRAVAVAVAVVVGWEHVQDWASSDPGEVAAAVRLAMHVPQEMGTMSHEQWLGVLGIASMLIVGKWMGRRALFPGSRVIVAPAGAVDARKFADAKAVEVAQRPIQKLEAKVQKAMTHGKTKVRLLTFYDTAVDEAIKRHFRDKGYKADWNGNHTIEISW